MHHFIWLNPLRAGNLKHRLKAGVIEGLIPLMIQLLILGLAILEFVVIVGPENGAPMIQAAHTVGGESSNPNLARFIYMFAALLLSVCLYVLAKRLSKRGKIKSSFWFGIIGGILLWQSIGECSWHFRFKILGTYISFPHIEGPDGGLLLLLLLIILALPAGRKHIHWDSGIIILSFMSNWIGHFALKGTYPLFAARFSEMQWYAISGCIFGIPAILFALYLMFFAAQDTKGRLISSITLYTGLGTLCLGVMGL